MTLWPLTARSILARRRPRAVLVSWAWDAALGVAVGSSFASVASTAYARHPDGDVPLFAPGGLELLDLLRHAAAARGPLLSGLLVALVVARLVGLVPAAAVMAELAFATRARGAPPWREAFALGAKALPASFRLEVLTLVTQGATLTSGLAIAAAATTSTAASLGPRGSDLLGLALGVVAFAAVAAVGVLGDLTRAAAVRWDAGALAAGQHGLRRFAARPVALSWSYAWRAAAAWVPVAIGGWLAAGIGGRGGVALLVLAGFHQGVVGVRAAVKASWLACALREVARGGDVA